MPEGSGANAPRLRFGTAGLRAPLGEGPLRMNAQVVELAATAIAKWLPANSEVIIGRDARHGSADFAAVTARVMADAGHKPRLFDEPVPTPVVAYAVGATNAVGGVVVTASHNRATDNGYKVYAADGSQILPDVAEIIEAHMEALPWPEHASVELPESIEILDDELIDAYLAAISESVDAQSRIARTSDHRSGVVVAYTAMHGVGGELFTRALEAAGHRVVSVPEQFEPDPDFPTAAFPNPEEPGTLDLVTALAKSEDADLVLANDPDADRLGVAVKRTGAWERLTGDQIGVLLGWYMIGRTEGPRSVATTIVSSSLLSKVAEDAGVKCHHTLTGFKWLMQADSPELPLVFAYEEALGYSVTPSIRDKDGISAGLLFTELVAEMASSGQTVDDVLATLYELHGYHVTSQVSSRISGSDPMAQMAQRMTDFRSGAPTSIGGVPVVQVVDLLNDPGDLDPSDVLIFQLDGARVIIRPSGTEPKIKAYLEAIDAEKAVANARMEQLVEAVAALVSPDDN